MTVFNGNTFRTSAPTTYGFEPGHVFAIKERFDEVLYKHISHDRHVLTASPLANPELRQVFSQDDLRELVGDGKLDPRIEQNRESRQKLLARSPDIKSARDLPDDDREELAFYWQLCRHVVQMYDDGNTSLTDKALKGAIGKVMATLVYGVEEEDVVGSVRGKERARLKQQGGAAERTIRARKVQMSRDAPSPSTLRSWIRVLEQHEWDILALRDHRKGRVGHRLPKITDPHSVALMAKWVQAYLDRSRPSAAILFKLMVGSMTLEKENAQRLVQGNPPLRGTDAPSFAAANLERTAQGLPPMPVPSKSTFERAIRKLDSFTVQAARRGPAYARRKHKVSGRIESVLFPGERVSIDCWRVQLRTLKLPHEFWEGMPEELVDKLGRVRLVLCAAVDEATKVVFGARLNWTANADTAIRTLEMVCRDKSEIAIAAGCRSTWHHACTPETVPTDSGSEFIDAGFRCAVRDIGSANEIGPASHPDARGMGERFFETLDLQLMQFFQGRTFSGVDDKGDYDAGAVANMVTETLGQALVRYIVDVHHNSPHAGLGGQTPNDAWVERAALYKVLPPPAPHVIRTVFGFSDNRRIQNRGVRFLGRYYRSSETAKLRKSIGQADVRMRADLEDLDMIWVSKNVPGAEWFAVPCEVDMKGVSAALWLEAMAALRRKHADVSKLREHVVHAALRDLRDAGRHSAAAAGIGPSAMSRTQLLKLEKELVEHFDYTVAGDRGRSFEGLEDDAIDALEADAGQEAGVTGQSEEAAREAGDEDDYDESQRPVARRRTRLGSDFLKKGD
ncbi:Mu transposase C-terminal domain-containing protein [Mesorhizobium sp. CAU 1732]|uniref:Mu transposase C-terminal domain-containing protein n=1 Tax=Mesorhizobium sp. CAU 1732 TaxID=3140358 RepID=UPI003261174B